MSLETKHPWLAGLHTTSDRGTSLETRHPWLAGLHTTSDRGTSLETKHPWLAGLHTTSDRGTSLETKHPWLAGLHTTSDRGTSLETKHPWLDLTCCQQIDHSVSAKVCSGTSRLGSGPMGLVQCGYILVYSGQWPEPTLTVASSEETSVRSASRSAWRSLHPHAKEDLR